MSEAGSHEGSFNAPVLVAWLLKHYDEEPTAVSGLQFVLKHLQTGEGCYLMNRYSSCWQSSHSLRVCFYCIC